MTTPSRRSKRLLVDEAFATSPDAAPSNAEKLSTLVTPDVPGSSTPNRATKRVKGTKEHDSPIRPDVAASSSGWTSTMLVKSEKSMAVKTVAISSDSNLGRPSPKECAYVVHELGTLHPSVLEDTKKAHLLGSCGAKPDILDGVVSTMLSQNTTNANSTRAFANLKKAFPTWDAVTKLTCPAKLEQAIRCGGLAKIKAQRIMTICRTLQEERGTASLEHLRNFSNEQIQSELMRFPGLGKKTVSCVLLFTLGRDEFPVDTHVHRISKQLKWIPPSYGRDDAYDYLNAVVPPQLKRNLHCLLIQHGRECHRCAARGKPQFPPKDGSRLKCPLVNLPVKDVKLKIELRF